MTTMAVSSLQEVFFQSDDAGTVNDDEAIVPGDRADTSNEIIVYYESPGI